MQQKRLEKKNINYIKHKLEKKESQDLAEKIRAEDAMRKLSKFDIKLN